MKNKKSRQRFLDYAYKIGLKTMIINLHKNKIIDKNDIANIWIYLDQHNTATDGIYELRESLLSEFKEGTFNWNFKVFHEPICKNIKNIFVTYKNSNDTPLIRVADIYSNYLYCIIKNNIKLKFNNFLIVDLP